MDRESKTNTAVSQKERVNLMNSASKTANTNAGGRQIIIVLDSPKVSLEPGQKGGDLLLNFYRALGWNGMDYLDPRQVRTTKEVYCNLYDQIYRYCPDSLTVGMLMVNSGPSTEEHIPPNKVYLHEGWTRPADQEERGDSVA